MLKVNEFRSTAEAMREHSKSKQRLERLKICWIPALIWSIYWCVLVPSTLLDNFPEFIILGSCFLMFIGMFVLSCYVGLWSYLIKLYFVPVRHMGFSLFSLTIQFLYLTFMFPFLFMAPMITMLYEKYICNLTLEASNDYI